MSKVKIEFTLSEDSIYYLESLIPTPADITEEAISETKLLELSPEEFKAEIEAFRLYLFDKGYKAYLKKLKK